MKLISYIAIGEKHRHRRLGVVLGDGIIANLRAGHARRLAEAGDLQAEAIAAVRIGIDVAALLAGGPAAMQAARDTADWLERLHADQPDARGIDDEPLFLSFGDAHLFAPLAPSKVIAAGRNYGAHKAEMSTTELPYLLPSTWLKGAHAIIGPHDDIVRPGASQRLDYETEMAAVIGVRCKNVPRERAMDVIAGYTIANDVTARDVGRMERAEGNRLLAKSFDGFCPLGPCVVTADEIKDPNNLNLRTRVNSNMRQDANTSDMIWKLADIIAYVSQIELLPGDVITTGSPEGVAQGGGGQPDKFLVPGDVLESEIEGIGIMRNTIVEDRLEPSWDWSKAK
jgi:2-keto-4-pentenoate hydratase/2-oxohepta-3-ene-1,7-dioic acid hydratase in catechol pathway